MYFVSNVQNAHDKNLKPALNTVSSKANVVS